MASTQLRGARPLCQKAASSEPCRKALAIVAPDRASWQARPWPPMALPEAVRRSFGVGLATWAPRRLTKKASGNSGSWPDGADGGSTKGGGLLQLTWLLQLRKDELEGVRVGSLHQPFPFIVGLRASPQAALCREANPLEYLSRLGMLPIRDPDVANLRRFDRTVRFVWPPARPPQGGDGRRHGTSHSPPGTGPTLGRNGAPYGPDFGSIGNPEARP